MADATDYSELIVWLTEKGHSQTEIDKIVDRVKQFEDQMQHDSVMDSIAAGHLNLSAIIEEALAEDV